MKILVINAGSSSLKYQLIDPETETVFAKGHCERIGIDGRLNHNAPASNIEVSREIQMPTHKEALNAVLEVLIETEYRVVQSIEEIDAVGHRVLYGGSKFSGSCLIDEDCKQAIRDFSFMAPLHIPANLMGIEACQTMLTDKPQIAVFDTAFHMTMPPKAYRYAIPDEYYENDGIRRYGFHGTSHRYIAKRMEVLTGRSDLRIISCHLGNGASLCAIKNGKCQDTTMGFGPLSGVPMGTRAGDVDATVTQFIMKKYAKTADEVLAILNKKSGVYALSGNFSSDFRDLDEGATAGNQKCRLALDKFAYEVKKSVGAYAAALDGLDVLVFTAGVGENAPNIREKVCNGLDFLGIKLDSERNKSTRTETLISADTSKVEVWVIPTNEELMIAQETATIAKKYANNEVKQRVSHNSLSNR